MEASEPLPLLVLITGPGGTGKTSLGRWLSEATGLPFFYKDAFKEKMYDTVIERQGIEGITLEVTRLLGRISIQCLETVLEEMLSQRLSLIVEANFDSALFSPVVQELRRRHPFHVVQAQLKCEETVLLERFMRREREDRHPGHQGLERLALKHIRVRGEDAPIETEGDLLVFDTTDFSRVDYGRLLESVQKYLGSERKESRTHR